MQVKRSWSDYSSITKEDSGGWVGLADGMECVQCHSEVITTYDRGENGVASAA